jgi:PAS domain S-box-containing protein
MDSHLTRGAAKPPQFAHFDDVEVWLLDDSALDAELARQHLPGCRLRVFVDGAELLEAVARGPLPDMVVLDWELRELSGIEVCRFLRRSHDSLALPIVMVTGHAEESYVLEAFEAGANDYVRKPYLPSEFAARVLAAARSRRIYTTLVTTHASLEHERARGAESDSRYHALAQSGVIGIVECDLHGRVVDANDAYLGMIRRSRAQLLAHAGRSETSPLDARALRELIERGVTAQFERELVRSDGEALIVRVAAARLDGRSDRCIGYVLDVTHERQVEADRARLYAAERRARADAELASRMKDEFLAMVSHELRTPMNAVLGWASILQSRLEHDADAAKPLEVIQRNARLQAKLIEDILDVSRIISGKVRLDARELELRTVIQQAIDATRPAADAKSIAIEASLAVGTPTLCGDPDRLQQVVWNLVSNAVKYTPAGGRVTVSTRIEPAHVTIDVVDTGSGIAAENLAAIFERFHQIDGSTTRAHGGLGLGLAIVRHLAEMHGGSVSATSRGLGLGSTFSVRLPIAGNPVGATPLLAPVSGEPMVGAAERSTEPISLAGLLVAVVDDEADSRSFACAALRRAGAEVLECSNAAQALDMLERRRPAVLVSDISMPGHDGYDLIARVRRLPAERGGGIATIALTAHAREDDIARCLAAGFDRHLAKPLEAAALVRCVADVRGS